MELAAINLAIRLTPAIVFPLASLFGVWHGCFRVTGHMGFDVGFLFALSYSQRSIQASILFGVILSLINFIYCYKVPSKTAVTVGCLLVAILGSVFFFYWGLVIGERGVDF